MSIIYGPECIALTLIIDEKKELFMLEKENYEKIEILFSDALSNTFSNLTKNDCSSITNQIRQNKNLKEKMLNFQQKGIPVILDDLLPVLQQVIKDNVITTDISQLLSNLNGVISNDADLNEKLHNLYLQIIIKNGQWDQVTDYYYSILKNYEKANDQNKIAETYNNLGLIQQNKGEWNKAIEFYNKSAILFEKEKNNKSLAQTWGNLGNVYQAKAELDTAIEYYNKSLAAFEQLKDESGMALTYNNLGLVYQDKRDSEKAADYYQKSWDLFEKTADFQGMAQSTGNLCTLEFENKNYKKAIKQFFEILFLYMKYDARDQVNQAFSIIKYFTQQLESYQANDIIKSVQEELSRDGITWGQHSILTADEVKQYYSKMNQKKTNQ